MGGGYDYTGTNVRPLTSQPIPNTAGATPTGWKVVLSAAASGSIYVRLRLVARPDRQPA